MIDWRTQADELILMAWELRNAKIVDSYKYYLMDKHLRLASSVISCEAAISKCIPHCKWWSKEAIRLYENVVEEMTLKCLKTTHRAVLNYREDSKPRWIMEHQYPLQIPKTMVKQGCSSEDLKEWMYNFGKVTIVTKDEDERLPKVTTCMKEAAARYPDAGVEIDIHPLFRNNL